METSLGCYQMADQRERQAAEINNEKLRELLLEVAAQWRRLGAGLRTREVYYFQPSSRGRRVSRGYRGARLDG